MPLLSLRPMRIDREEQIVSEARRRDNRSRLEADTPNRPDVSATSVAPSGRRPSVIECAQHVAARSPHNDDLLSAPASAATDRVKQCLTRSRQKRAGLADKRISVLRVTQQR